MSGEIETQVIPGDPIVKECAPDPCTVVIFGARGDLTRRKLVPALYNVMVDGALPDRFAILGLSRASISSDAFRKEMHKSTGEFSRRKPLDNQAWDRFAAALEYVSGEFEDPPRGRRMRPTEPKMTPGFRNVTLSDAHPTHPSAVEWTLFGLSVRAWLAVSTGDLVPFSD